MKLTLVRNATQLLSYAGKTFLIDPMFAEKGAWPGFAGTARSHLRNPLVSLPVAPETLLSADAIIITHLHTDHWDESAQQLIPKDKLIYAQNEQDAEQIRAQNFTNVHLLKNEILFHDITIFKTDGQHGSNEAYRVPELAARLGETCGLVFQHPQEKTLYIAGDTVWAAPYSEALKRYNPDIVVLNAGSAQLDGFGAIIMEKEDVLKTHRMLPDAVIVAVHMEAINHCILSRAELKDYVTAQGIARQVQIPEDGESLLF